MKVVGRVPLKPGDRISAGHLVIIYDRAGRRKPVVVFDPADETTVAASSSTVVTDLGDVISDEKAGAARIASVARFGSGARRK